ncbi:MAG: pyridoxal phosphate-dependent aminotransferase [Thermoanaerobaculia bacterium]
MSTVHVQQPKPLLPGGILAITAECRRRRALGEQIIDLSLGEPDFDTPPHICEAAMLAIEEGGTRYTAPAGLPQLRQMIVRSLGAEGLRFAPREVMVTCGATGAIFCALQALLRNDDEVLLPAPFYPQYLNPITLAGAHAVVIPTNANEDFKLDPQALRAAIAPRSRLLILNAPSNPAGVVYTHEELTAIAAVAREHQLTILSDEVYSAFTFGKPFVSMASVAPERTLVVRSVSKTYAMTGWRVGFAAGPAALIAEMTAVQEACIVTPATVSQWAAVEALRGPQECVTTIRDEFARRRELATTKLRAIAGVHLAASDGGMFVFPDLSSRVSDVDAFCTTLLRQHGVAVVPGSEFGVPGCIRISLGSGVDDLAVGIERLAAALPPEGTWN